MRERGCGRARAEQSAERAPCPARPGPPGGYSSPRAPAAILNRPPPLQGLRRHRLPADPTQPSRPSPPYSLPCRCYRRRTPAQEPPLRSRLTARSAPEGRAGPAGPASLRPPSYCQTPQRDPRPLGAGLPRRPRPPGSGGGCYWLRPGPAGATRRCDWL